VNSKKPFSAFLPSSSYLRTSNDDTLHALRVNSPFPREDGLADGQRPRNSRGCGGSILVSLERRATRLRLPSRGRTGNRGQPSREIPADLILSVRRVHVRANSGSAKASRDYVHVAQAFSLVQARRRRRFVVAVARFLSRTVDTTGKAMPGCTESSAGRGRAARRRGVPLY